MALALAAGLSDRDEFRVLFNFFGALVGFMNAGEILLRQILGGAAEAKNPLLKRILEMTTPIASLMAQLLGFLAILVRRIGPVLPSLASMMVGLKALIGATLAALDEIMKGLFERIDEARTSGESLADVVKRVIAVTTRQVEISKKAFKAQLTIILDALTLMKTKITGVFDKFLDGVLEFLKQQWKQHPIVKVVDAFRLQIDIITKAFESAPKKEESDTDEPGFFDPLIATLPTPPSMPDFPPVPDLPDAKKLKATLGGDDIPPVNFDEIEKAAKKLGKKREPLTLSEDARRAIQQSINRPSVFAGERQAFQDKLEMTPAAALAENAAQLGKLREALSVVVGRILPPEMRAVYAPKLHETLFAIDQKLYGIEGPINQPPVLDLPTNENLRPVVKLLRFRMPGAGTAEVRAFQDKLIERLQGQQYLAPTQPVPVAAPAGVP
jgi:hypothetical protein